jgi:hypothetical protein
MSSHSGVILAWRFDRFAFVQGPKERIGEDERAFVAPG